MALRKSWALFFSALAGVAVAIACGSESRTDESDDGGGAPGSGGASSGGASGSTTNGGTSGTGLAGESGESSGGTPGSGGRGGSGGGSGQAGTTGGRSGAGGTPSRGGAGAGGVPPSAGTGGRAGSSAGGGAGGRGGAAGTGGFAGKGGAGATGPYACEQPTPATCGQINDFSTSAAASWGSGNFSGGVSVFGSGITRDTTTSALHVTGTVTGYGAGFNLWFSRCSNLAAYTGITFTLSGMTGSLTQSNTMDLQIQTNADYPWQPRPLDNKGACTAATPMDAFSMCVSPGLGGILLAASPQLVTWPQIMGGMPTAWSALTSPAELVGIQWLFPWSEGSQPYDVDVTLDNVRFAGGTGPTTACPTTLSGASPCSGLCSNPTVFAERVFSSPPLGTGESCWETTAQLGAFGCTHFTPPRLFRLNNVEFLCDETFFNDLPAGRNGGYCFQISAGEPANGGFHTL